MCFRYARQDVEQDSRMTGEELNALLAQKQALLVHFSHHSNMREGSEFPGDLQAAIDNVSRWDLSCCLIWPGHPMKLPGSVGVIIEPTVSGVVSVSPDDSGSSSLGSLGEQLTKESLERSFALAPGRYNEWRIVGKRALGIFVTDPNCIWVKQRGEIFLPENLTESGRAELLDSTSTIRPQRQSLQYVKNAFPNIEIFTFRDGKAVTL